MARYTGPSCKLCRREGEKLFLKGDKCYMDKCPVAKRAYAPGQHGQQRKKLSEYGMQLREKQKARRFYGVLEKQFRNYFEMANKMKGVTGENLLRLLESRLDNVVYRLGLAASRPEARQLVKHSHITVNGKKVNIPSYLVTPGDVIAVAEGIRNSEKIKIIIENTGNRVVPSWLEFDAENLTGRVVSLPTREEIDLPVKEHLIVELYSK
ncbi:MAG: 30S ribosomal protein S4 [Clostridiaceae bacterium]|nr:30S ribosomal protein S4 [Clostridiaceae bacterium]